ncbi:ABC transporter permease subunit [Bacillus sp. FJAT-49705]|uniref:ABC transporter permease subunit n=1 Tax=Cytobacillus citreus TaxID=2833586 RepID=A0ABS5P0B5_9BACI|nr:ABC transporter permease subunit [Cytobacillus citreus]MBS4193118.1 ABC transporter permease subunit [Cytobacillus citreus]
MMALFQFEFKKAIKQRKILWLIFIVLLIGSGVFIQNDQKKSLRSDRASDRITPFFSEIGDTRNNLQTLSREGILDDAQTLQLEAINDIGTALTLWKVAINNEKWAYTPIYEMEFWEGIQTYENYGGQFSKILGMERDIAIQKNKWMVEHQLSYDDELFPISSGLVVNQVADWFFSIWGLLILLLFFGTIVSEEKVQNTWLLLKTQPITKWKMYVSKFLLLTLIVVLFMLTVFLVGLCIPLLFSDYGMNFDYPQIVTFGDHFVIISALDLFFRKSVLFLGSSLFIFSLIILFSNWMKDSFSTLLFTTLTLLISYLITLTYTTMQKIWNPLNTIYSLPLTQEMTINEIMYAAFFSVIWSAIIILLSIYIPEKNIGILQGKTIIKPFARGNISQRQSTIQKLMIFEWLKIYRKGLFMQVTIVILLLISFHFISTFQESKELKENYLNKLNNLETEHELLILLKEQVTAFEQMKENDKIRDNRVIDWQITEATKAISILEEEVQLAKLAYNAYQSSNWIPFHQYQLFVNRLFNEEFETGLARFSIKKETGQMMLDASIEEKNWLIKHNIQPIFTGEFIITPFSYWNDQEKEFWEEWINRNKKVESNGLYILYSLFNQYYVFILMILLFILVGGGLAAERGKNATIRFLLTQPHSLNSIYHAKWLTAIGISLTSSIGFFAFTIVLGILFDRFGDWMYPILVYDTTSIADASHYEGFYSQGMGFHFIPIGEYILQAVLLYCLILVFLLTLSHVCALFMNQLSVFTLVFILSFSGYFTGTALFSRYAHLSPFTFLNVEKIINGEIAVTLNNSSITVTAGINMLIISTIFIWLIGNIYTIRTNSKL